MFSVCKVSIIITAHNYGRFLRQALDSALRQNFSSPYEVIVVNDGSTDHTSDILRKYQGDSEVRILTLDGVGLARACNAGIRASKGQYIIRLDADDWFDENILLVEASILDNKPEVGMVYPDYYLVDRYGSIIDHVRLQKVHDEIKLLDRNALAAGALYRRECYDEVGGYNEGLDYQEDYDFWLRFTEKFNVYNVNLPLMYYRQHSGSMSTNSAARLRSRRWIKRASVGNRSNLEILAVIPAKGDKWLTEMPLALTELEGRPIIDYSIASALSTLSVSRVLVSTDSLEVAQHSIRMGAEAPFLRPKQLTAPSSPLRDTLLHALEYLDAKEDYSPDYVIQLQVISPLRLSEHIQEAIDSILLYDTDSVISVTKDSTFHWRPGQNGLEPLIWKKRLLRKDKDTVYRENGAIYLYKTETLYEKEGLGGSVGHIEMLPEESVRIFTQYDFWLCDKILSCDRIFR